VVLSDDVSSLLQPHAGKAHHGTDCLGLREITEFTTVPDTTGENQRYDNDDDKK
jgi:hypothetical protein